VRTHGDFKRTNFMFGKGGRIEGLFDWDLSIPDGLPLMDLCVFMGYEATSMTNQELYEPIFTELVNKSPLQHPLTQSYFKNTFEIDEFRARALAFEAVVYYLAFHLKSFIHDPKMKDRIGILVTEGNKLFHLQNEIPRIQGAAQIKHHIPPSSAGFASP